MTKPVRLDDGTHKDVKSALKGTLKVYTNALKKFSKCGVDLEDKLKFPEKDKACRAVLQTIMLLLKVELMIQQDVDPKRDKDLEEAYEDAARQFAELGDQFDD